MGYTHYYTRLKKLPARKFKAWADDVRAIVTHSGVPIAGHDGEGEPEITPTYVCLNGRGDDAYETFGVDRDVIDQERGRYFEFTKTNHKPYDVVVTAALIRLHHRLPKHVDVDSDGDANDWKAGMRLCLDIFGDADLPPGIRAGEN